jgi:hypothetical protein
MKKLTIIAALLCGTAHAEFFTGNDLLAKMNGGNSYDASMALGYVTGVFDTALGVDHCAPDRVTAGQARDIVRNYLEANPSVRQYSADIHTRIALGRAWPCPKKNTGSGV